MEMVEREILGIYVASVTPFTEEDKVAGDVLNIMLPHYQKIFDAFQEGKVRDAEVMQHKANNIMEALCSVGLIPAIKYVLSAQGIPAGNPRSPFAPLEDEAKACIDRALEENLIVC